MEVDKESQKTAAAVQIIRIMSKTKSIRFTCMLRVLQRHAIYTNVNSRIAAIAATAAIVATAAPVAARSASMLVEYFAQPWFVAQFSWLRAAVAVVWVRDRGYAQPWPLCAAMAVVRSRGRCAQPWLCAAVEYYAQPLSGFVIVVVSGLCNSAWALDSGCCGDAEVSACLPSHLH